MSGRGSRAQLLSILSFRFGAREEETHSGSGSFNSIFQIPLSSPRSQCLSFGQPFNSIFQIRVKHCLTVLHYVVRSFNSIFQIQGADGCCGCGRLFGLSILSFRFVFSVLTAAAAGTFTFNSIFQILERALGQCTSDLPVPLSILSFRFCVLGLPSLLFRFRLRIRLIRGFISFYLGSCWGSLGAF